MRHHTDEYPITQLTRPAPYVGADGEKAFGPFIAGLVLCYYVLFRRIMGLSMTFYASFNVSAGMFTAISDHLHSQYHIENSYLEKYAWFREKQRRHHLHHHKYLKNMSLGGLAAPWDRVLGSFAEASRGSEPDSDAPSKAHGD